MSDITALKPKGKPRGRPFRKGRSGNPRGRFVGSRNKATLAAQALLDGEAERITRTAVEMAGDRDPTAVKLCLDKIVASRRERVVQFALPPINGSADIAAAMRAVTAAIADGAITPGEAEAFARVVEIFMRAIDVSDFERRLQVVEAYAARS